MGSADVRAEEQCLAAAVLGQHSRRRTIPEPGDNANENRNGNQNNASPHCGNGVVDSLEECDDGLQNSDSLENACRTDCRRAFCGDSVEDASEQCDNGPQNSDEVPNACRTDCSLPRCGDGVVDTDDEEGCDCGDGSMPLPSACIMPNSDDASM